MPEPIAHELPLPSASFQLATLAETSRWAKATHHPWHATNRNKTSKKVPNYFQDLT
jgi:hypothetical protein